MQEKKISLQPEYINAVKKYTEAYGVAHARAPRAFVQTFGCQQNEADSERLAGLAKSMGYELTDTPESAQLIIVNTCAVREHAEKKTLSVIGQYKHIKAEDPELIIAVCGCMVGQEHRRNELKMRYPYVDFTFPPASPQMLPKLLSERLAGGRRVFVPGEERPPICEDIPVHRESKHRAWVSVMYGCNNFCTYCIVPYVRGRERSRAPEDIIAEVRGLAEAGVRDITLLGQNVNSYGKNTDFDCDFSTLLRRVSEVDGDFRLRFMTSHPKDATFALIDAIAECDKVAKHLHLPVQSGSDRILERMNRHYSVESYMEKLDYLRARVPDAAVTSDIIVGFPGETEEDFLATLDILRRARYDRIFSFIYSPRRGTPAAEMEDQIAGEVKSERFARLIELQNEITLEKNRELVGKTFRVLCDGVSRTNEKYLEGRTEHDRIVIFEGEGIAIGDTVELEITKADTFNLFGKILEK
ncbi:MAG: tRNA (N6-isopentenyl adenosine(37)-C2)-methylthiotransferase MiaB [Ruminococcaceae bacterium]|nr:tRNA (N6-isopentenyl adenosine(37)-C2)-methylthiotransferase MiaB [Oscillospiraceae bacterium]